MFALKSVYFCISNIGALFNFRRGRIFAHCDTPEFALVFYRLPNSIGVLRNLEWCTYGDPIWRYA